MVRIETKKDNNKYIRIAFRGHADYEEYGKDIVCAAVSSTMLCTVNAIYLISGDSINFVKTDNDIIIEVIKDDDISNKLINNMMSCLKDLEKQYPKNIKIK